MIRVNLLPQRKQRKQEVGQRQLIYMGFALLVVAGGMMAFHLQTEAELAQLQSENAAVQADIDRLKAELGDYDKIRAQREELMRQQKTIEELQSRRTGPVFALRELSELLSPTKGPTFDKEDYGEVLRRDPNAGFNAAWDTRRVWLTNFDEKARSVNIEGSAKSNEDVAEFMKRLAASVFFKGVVLEKTNQVTSSGNNPIKYLTFNLNTQVVY
jgi:type IV pilus assembly protein PilN